MCLAQHMGASFFSGIEPGASKNRAAAKKTHPSKRVFIQPLNKMVRAKAGPFFTPKFLNGWALEVLPELEPALHFKTCLTQF